MELMTIWSNSLSIRHCLYDTHHYIGTLDIFKVNFKGIFLFIYVIQNTWFKNVSIKNKNNKNKNIYFDNNGTQKCNI